jgi:hypothetical protein
MQGYCCKDVLHFERPANPVTAMATSPCGRSEVSQPPDLVLRDMAAISIKATGGDVADKNG